jgi:signal transduction histidine kinase/ligand-binding sensor domain-containing protein
MPSFRRCLHALLLLACLVLPSAAWAAAPVRGGRAALLQHAVWLPSDGAPVDSSAIVQDHDGYLWLAGHDGLVRFDGVSFDRDLEAQLPETGLNAAYVARDGALWLGTVHGLLMRCQGGRVTTYPRGEITSTIVRITETSDGTLWAVSTRGAFRFQQGQWRRTPSQAGGPTSGVQQAVRDAQGQLWLVSMQGTAWHWVPQRGRFEEATAEDAHAALLGRTGTGWRPEDLANDEAVDTDGSVWMPVDEGVLHVSWADTGTGASGPPRLELYGRQDGLSGGAARAVFIDRDGTLWVSTSGGLDQFRRGEVQPWPLGEDAYQPAMTVDDRGDLWVAEGTQAVQFTAAGHRTWPEAAGRVSVATPGTGGEVYLSAAGWVRRFGPSGVHDMPVDPAVLQRPLKALAQASDGSLWVGAAVAYRLQGARWQRLGREHGLPDDPDYIERIVPSADGTVWLGYTDNQLAHMRADGTLLTKYGPGDGLAIGHVLSIAPMGHGTWIGGQHGVQFVTPAGHALDLRPQGSAPWHDVVGIVQRADGNLWLRTGHALVHVDGDSIAHWTRDPSWAVPFESLDARDGVPGNKDPTTPTAALLQGRGDRLWVASQTGIGWIDVDHLPRPAHAPTVRLLAVNGQPQDGHATQLPAGTTRLEVTFTAPVLGRPDRARFRYRLQGLDDAWQDNQGRRQASWANLGPGTYHVEVMAANEDGVWSTAPASAVVRIAPFFYQTLAFRLLSLAAAGALVYAACVWRLRRMGALMSARLLERERIARELHDTVLQSLHAVLLHVKVATQAVSDEAARQKLERAMRATQHALAEGRRRVAGLRGRRDAPDALRDWLQAHGALLTDGSGMRFDLRVTGTPRPINPAAEDDIQGVAYELLSNAVRHSGGHHLRVTLGFGRWSLRLDVVDDGRGFSPGHPATHGSFGLLGLRERADKLAARLAFRVPPGGGTHATLRVPAPVAYRTPARGESRWGSRR